jgi:hypothetical protein
MLFYKEEHAKMDLRQKYVGNMEIQVGIEGIVTNVK